MPTKKCQLVSSATIINSHYNPQILYFCIPDCGISLTKWSLGSHMGSTRQNLCTRTNRKSQRDREIPLCRRTLFTEQPHSFWPHYPYVQGRVTIYLQKVSLQTKNHKASWTLRTTVWTQTLTSWLIYPIHVNLFTLHMFMTLFPFNHLDLPLT